MPHVDGMLVITRLVRRWATRKPAGIKPVVDGVEESGEIEESLPLHASYL